jgi:cytochrome c
LRKFKYSKDVKAAGEKGLVWNAETFVPYIASPNQYLGRLLGKKKAKTKLAFNGLRKSKDRDDFLAYLMSVTK